MIIPLRQKYLSASNGRYRGGERAAPRKSRDKIGHDKHVALFGEPPKMTMIAGVTGRNRMVRA